MKKIVAALFLAAFIIFSSTVVSAEHYWNNSIKFTAAFGTVNINGDGNGWDDAEAIKMTLNNDPMYDRGFLNYQGEWDGDRNDSDYSGIYKIKWDMEYIYFFEDRKDDYVNLQGDGEQPYFTDGVLIFTQVDSADGKMNPEGISVHVFYTVGNGSGQIGGDVKARICNIEDNSRETIDIPGAKIASTLKSGGYIVEIAIPWAFYTSQVPNFKGPSAGNIMGLSYVVHDNDDPDGTGFVKQFCYAVDNDNMSDVPGGYDFGGWGVLELLPAPVVTLPAEVEVVLEPEVAAPVEEAAPAPVAEAVPAPPPQPAAAAQTGNSAMIILGLFALISAGVFVKVRKNHVK